MSKTTRNIQGKEFPDSKMCENPQKDKNPKKSFVYRGEGWTTKARGGSGNKRGWKNWIPKWLFKKYKSEPIKSQWQE